MRWERRIVGVTDGGKVDFAREQRQSPTRSEGILWEAVRKRALGVRFRRQHPIGEYVVDFYCGERQLAVELDGPVHDGQEGYDRQRDDWLASRGIRVLRIAEELVRRDLTEAVRRIREALRDLR